MDNTNPQPAKAGLTGKQKVVLLAGAALLLCLYKRYQSQGKAAAAAGGAKPQLYREDKGPNKGAIYYRKNDASHTVVWLQAPAQGVRIPADQAQQTLGRGSTRTTRTPTNPLTRSTRTRKRGSTAAASSRPTNMQAQRSSSRPIGGRPRCFEQRGLFLPRRFDSPAQSRYNQAVLPKQRRAAKETSLCPP